ncbi:MAG TPA: YceK/YidQ family lipoprotein [Methylobacter sp.]
MKSAFGRWMTVVFISSFILGCSSIRARTETPDKEWTVYPGFQQDIKDTDRVLSGKNPDPGWVKGMVTTLLVLDLPFSAVFDTVVMPYDLYLIYVPKHPEENAEKEQDNPP